MATYYVYEIIDPRNNLPYYVGKGKGNRANWHIEQRIIRESTGNQYKDRITDQIFKDGLYPVVRKVFFTDDEIEAYNVEAKLIKRYGRRKIDPNGILTNICEDSRPPIPIHNDNRRERSRQRLLGNQINKGRVQSKEEKEQRAKSLKAAYASGRRIFKESTRQRLSEVHSGKIVSKKTKQLISEKAKSAHTWRYGKTNEEIFGEEKAKQIRDKKAMHPPPNRKEIEIDGIKYQSIRMAAKSLGISEYKAKKRAE